MRINKRVLKHLAPLMLISFFYKPLMLAFLILFILYYFLMMLAGKVKIDLFSFIFTLYLFFLSFYTSVFVQGKLTFLFNNLLFFIFISPLLMMIITDFKSRNLYIPPEEAIYLKKAIEIFLWIQILFSFINGLKRAVEYHFRLDVNFGDIIAGTFRLPLIYTPDASNVIFSFTMVLVLFLYIVYYGRQASRALVIASVLMIFLASVNHIILAAGLALFLTLIWRYTTSVIALSLAILGLYPVVQPTNFRLILERINLLVSNFSLENIANLSLKGQFIYNFITDFMHYPLTFIFTGLGPGTYSGRAALFFTGEYVRSFPFKNISDFMYNNTYILWHKLISSPPWLAGSFNYPYGSLFSFIAELGLLNTLIFFFLIFKKLKEKAIFSNLEILFILIFLFLVGLIDNYYEYFQATFIFFYILYNLPPKHLNLRRST